jgi:hypothetical protein
MHDVLITLSGAVQNAHSGAMVFTGVDQDTPVRASASASGVGTASTVTVESAPGDLVVNTVGQGSKIGEPGPGQTERFIRNVDASATLNNSAGSTAPGTGSVTMTWTFPSPDEWQTIALSLRP